MEIERVPTGIDQLDKKIEGGIPKNSTTLIAGESGTGKTTFSLQWLAQGDDPAYYCTYQPKKTVNKMIEYLGIKKKINIIEIAKKSSSFTFDFVDIGSKDDKHNKLAIDSFTELIDYQIPQIFLNDLNQYYKNIQEMGETRKDLIVIQKNLQSHARKIHDKMDDIMAIYKILEHKLREGDKKIERNKFTKDELINANEILKDLTEKDWLHSKISNSLNELNDSFRQFLSDENIKKLQEYNNTNQIVEALKSLQPTFLSSEFESFRGTEAAAHTWIRKYLADLNNLDNTILLTAEAPYGSDKISKDGIIDFLVDNVIYLTCDRIGSTVNMFMKIHKMRLTKHYRANIPYDITAKGLKILKNE